MKNSNFLRGLTYKFPSAIAECFKPINLSWQVLAIVLTFVLASTGFDWKYFELFGHGIYLSILFPAAILGFFVPVFLPIVLLILGRTKSKATEVGYATAQAAILGWLLSSFYKALTGRSHPILFSTQDISKAFKFGFLRGGIFWGWPSSHTTVAFAVGVALFYLFPKNKFIQFFSLAYAIYIGIGVSVSIHWFSDFLAGAIIGSIVGISVAKNFKQLIHE